MTHLSHYSELHGHLTGGTMTPPRATVPGVVLSDLRGGAAVSRPVSGLALKYVARGAVVWHIDGGVYPVQAGRFLCVWQGLKSAVEVPRSSEGSTLGLCLLVTTEAGFRPDRDAPVVFSAHGSRLGELLSRGLKDLLHPGGGARAQKAASLLRQIQAGLEPFLEDTSRQLESIAAAKPSTRLEALRRLERARGHLHEITDRPVELGELARVAGVSRFQLLRNFRECFGSPPAAYHRRLRLLLAREEIERRRMTCAEAAHRFGFADGSSFSHAYRRAFGAPPVRSLR